MISYVKGILTELDTDSVIIECAGIGYEVMVPNRIAASLPTLGSEVKLYTYHSIREDAQDLFGFLSKDDLTVFRLLLTVSGVGPKGALSILSLLSANDVRMAVLVSDAKMISRANGIGSKTAQRIVLDLKDKFSADELLTSSNVFSPSVSLSGGAKDEAIEGLVSLGYSASDAMRAVSRLQITEDMNSEAILMAALKSIAMI